MNISPLFQISKNQPHGICIPHGLFQTFKHLFQPKPQQNKSYAQPCHNTNKARHIQRKIRAYQFSALFFRQIAAFIVFFDTEARKALRHSLNIHICDGSAVVLKILFHNKTSIKVTSYKVPFLYFFIFGSRFAANIHTTSATGMKFATLRRI